MERIDSNSDTVNSPGSGDIAAIRDCYLSGRFADALRAAQTLLDRHPDHAELLNLAGVCYMALGDDKAAEAALHRGSQAAPESADIGNNLGVLYRETGRQDEAERWFRHAIATAPGHGQALLNLGMQLRSAKRLDEAQHAISRAIEVAPDNHQAWNVLGLVLKDLRRFNEADIAHRRAMALDPHNASYRLNLGNLLLYRNNWSEGLPLFEARCEAGLQGTFSSSPEVPFPQWRGESLAGASLLIWPEQGYGDRIQLVRYVKRIKESGARHVTLVCNAATLALFSSMPEVDALVARERFDPSACPRHDFWTYIWSIPLNLKSEPESIPSELPYLFAPATAASKWERFFPKRRFRVGLVWKGNPGNENDRVRSLPSLKTLEALWQIEGITFVSLQKEATGEVLRSGIGDRFILNLGSRAADFADMAGIISRLDLVVGVDTAVMHLAAALGKPAWLLLSNVATDWRWTSEGSASIWYPGVVRLFRQDVGDTDWSGVVARVADALSAVRKAKP
jgi:Flp pilus assembly protein TadD